MDWLGATTHGSYSKALEFGSSAQLPPCDKPNHVMVKVTYSDVNPVDLQKLSGGSGKEGQEVPNPPFVPGFGGTGVVEQVGGSSSAPQHLVGKPVCFISDPSMPNSGSYASHVVVDSRCVVELPPNVDPKDAATIPVAGLTAYEVLAKLGLVRDNVAISDKQNGTMEMTGVAATSASASALSSASTHSNGIAINGTTTAEDATATMLLVGGSGGVGSWILTLMAAWHPHIKVIATATPGKSQEWCKSLGAFQTIAHNEIGIKLEGGKAGSVDYIVCLTEPKKALFDQLAEVIKPYGHIALVVSGKSIESLNLGFCFFKCVNIVTQTVFSSMRTAYKHIVPADELKVILRLLNQQTIKAPLSPDLESGDLSEKFKDALKDDGVLIRMSDLQRYPRRGKYVLAVNAGDSLIFLDFKTSSIISIPRKEVIAQKILIKTNLASKSNKPLPDSWKEEAKNDIERAQLIEKVTSNDKIGIVRIAEKQWTDYEDGIEMQEAENVKNLWGVQLKKREKNKKGEEFLFVDPRSGAIGEISRKACLDKGVLTIVPSDEAESGELIEEATVVADERESLAQEVRQALKLHLEC